LQKLVRELNRVYRAEPALWTRDSDHEGFRWIDGNDAGGNTLSYLRYGTPASVEPPVMACVVNFAGTPHENYRLGLPREGGWREVRRAGRAGVPRPATLACGRGGARAGPGRHWAGGLTEGFRGGDGGPPPRGASADARPGRRLHVVPGRFAVEHLPHATFPEDDDWIALVRAPEGLTVVREAPPFAGPELWAGFYGGEDHGLRVPGTPAEIVGPLADAGI